MFFFCFFISTISAQNETTSDSNNVISPIHSHQRNLDPRYSVFGPPKPALWKFQFAHMNRDNEGTSAFTFYKKNQRDKTLLFNFINNGLDNTNQYRVQQISGLVILFPFNDDDRYQFDLGGAFDKIKNLPDTTLMDSSFFLSSFLIINKYLLYGICINAL